MGNKRINESLSCFLVQPVAIGALFAGAFASSYFGFRNCGIFLLFSAVLALAANIWGRMILKDIRVTSDNETYLCYPGEVISIPLVIQNEKRIPMVWSQMMVGKEKETVARPLQEGPISMGGIRWNGATHQQLAMKTYKRGIYPFKEVTLRSGDGFGLSQTEAEYKVEHPSSIVVYPEYTPVYTADFLKNIWTGSNGNNGQVEDITVLRSTRDYEYTDSWKQIDWRLAARSEELQTKLYEKVRPRGIVFVLDSLSFVDVLAMERQEEACLEKLRLLQRKDETKYDAAIKVEESIDEKMSETMLEQELAAIRKEKEHRCHELEQAICVLASLCTELDEKNVATGIALPATREHDCVTILPEQEASMSERMISLARFDEGSATDRFHLEELAYGMASQYEVYCFCRTAKAAGTREYLTYLNPAKVTFVEYEPTQGATFVTKKGMEYKKVRMEGYYDRCTTH